MKIERFEDIRAWQQARELTNLVYDLTVQAKFSKDFRLRDQIQGAAGSIMHNIAEGFDDGSDIEFVRFLKYADGLPVKSNPKSIWRLTANTSARKIFNECMTQQPQPKNQSMPLSHTCENLNADPRTGNETIRLRDQETI